MSNTVYGKGLEAFGNGTINWVSDPIKTYLIDIAAYGVQITNATNASPIVITAAAHGRSNGERVMISGVGGNTAANGLFTVANATTNTFELQGSTGNGAYASGGAVIAIDADQYLANIPSGARIGSPVALTSKTNVLGVLDAADISFTGLTSAPSIEALVIAKDTGSTATSPLLVWIDSGGGLPVSAGATQVDVTWSNDANKIVTL